MKNKLCVFTLYSEKGASSQYRAFIFKDALEKKYNVHWYNFWNDSYVTKYMHNKKKYALNIICQYFVSSLKRIYQLLFIAPKADVVFIQKATIPKIKTTFLKKMKSKNVRIVFDVDDAVYTLPKDNSEKIAEAADCVICGNETLKGHYQRYCKNCVVIPTVDNTNLYSLHWKDTFDKKIIGWIGSKTTIDNFDLIIDALNEISQRHSEVKIAIISNTALDYTNKIKNSYLIPWSAETYLKALSTFTIGIMPLKDNEFTRGKCGFKLIQYLNMKKPVIGSGVGVNGKIIEGNGIEANTTEEWVCAIETLLYDETAYRRYVSHIEEVFFQQYHFDIVANQIMNILAGEC